MAHSTQYFLWYRFHVYSLIKPYRSGRPIFDSMPFSGIVHTEVHTSILKIMKCQETLNKSPYRFYESTSSKSLLPFIAYFDLIMTNKYKMKQCNEFDHKAHYILLHSLLNSWWCDVESYKRILVRFSWHYTVWILQLLAGGNDLAFLVGIVKNNSQFYMILTITTVANSLLSVAGE